MLTDIHEFYEYTLDNAAKSMEVKEAETKELAEKWEKHNPPVPVEAKRLAQQTVAPSQQLVKRQQIVNCYLLRNAIGCCSVYTSLITLLCVLWFLSSQHVSNLIYYFLPSLCRLLLQNGSFEESRQSSSPYKVLSPYN